MLSKNEVVLLGSVNGIKPFAKPTVSSSVPLDTLNLPTQAMFS